MRIIKLAIISIVFFAVVITIISFFFPSHIRISRATNIKTLPDSVWNYVDDTGKWDQWNTVKLPPEGMKWIQKNKEEHIAEMHTGSRPVITGWKCIAMPQADSITLQWYMDFRLRWYPWEKFRSLIFEKMYGLPMENGLGRLKDLLQ